MHYRLTLVLARCFAGLNLDVFLDCLALIHQLCYSLLGIGPEGYQDCIMPAADSRLYGFDVDLFRLLFNLRRPAHNCLVHLFSELADFVLKRLEDLFLRLG